MVQAGTAVFSRWRYELAYTRCRGAQIDNFSIPEITPTIVAIRKSRPHEKVQWTQEPVTSDFVGEFIWLLERNGSTTTNQLFLKRNLDWSDRRWGRSCSIHFRSPVQTTSNETISDLHPMIYFSCKELNWEIIGELAIGFPFRFFVSVALVCVWNRSFTKKLIGDWLLRRHELEPENHNINFEIWPSWARESKSILLNSTL